MPLKLRIEAKVNGESSKTWTGLAPASSPIAFGKVINLVDGVLANQADVIYLKERTIAASATDAIDVSGTLNDPSGSNVVMAKLVGIIVFNEPVDDTVPNLGNLVIGGGSNPLVGPFGNVNDVTGPLRAGGVYMMINPSLAGMGVVTPATGDLLNIVCSADGPATYQVCIIGRSA